MTFSSVDAGDVVEDRGLAGAVRADQAVDLPLLDLDGEVVDGVDAAEVLLHVLHFQHGSGDFLAHFAASFPASAFLPEKSFLMLAMKRLRENSL